MIAVKRKFQPSLDPISQVFDLQELSIVKPFIRDGEIRKQTGLIPRWKDRIFAFLYVPQQKLTCSIYAKNSEHPEETIDLGGAKISKKYSQVDGKLCFGVVTVQKQKYIISLNNPRDCIKLFFEVVSAKKLLKNYDMWREITVKQASSFQLSEDVPLSDSNSLKQGKSISRKLSIDEIASKYQKNQGQDPISQELQKQKSQQRSQEMDKDNQLMHADTAESIENQPYIKKSPKRLSSIQSSQKSENIDQVDRQLLNNLDHMEGYHAVEGFSKGKIYQDGKFGIKVCTTLKFSQSARSVIELFLHFENWNQKVKDMMIMKSNEKGVHKVALNFFKTSCFSNQKRCEALVTLYKVSDGYFMTMRSTDKIPPHIKKEQWFHFKMAVRIKETLECVSEKKMMISIQSEESPKIMMEFAREVKNFQDYLKTKLKLPSKLLQVKASIEK